MRRRELEFEIVDWVFLKVSPLKGVLSFGKKRKFYPLYIGPYQILERFGSVSHELDFPKGLTSIHLIFHVFILKKCVGDHSFTIPVQDISVKDSLLYEVLPIKILNREVQKLKTKEITLVEVLWMKKKVEELKRI